MEFTENTYIGSVFLYPMPVLNFITCSDSEMIYFIVYIYHRYGNAHIYIEGYA